jgi:DNA-directed RNA polymerase I, II, and III subunit RPABC1
MNNRHEVSNLFKCYRTVLELLMDRNYIISEDLQGMSFETFHIMYNNKDIDIFVNNGLEGDDEDNMYVKFFTDNNSFKKKNLLDLCEKVQGITSSTVRLIIIFMTNKLPTNATKKDLNNNIFRSIELFPMKDLLLNITHNVLVPRHRLIDVETIERVLDKYNCTIDQLPKLKLHDPVARYYGFKIGDVCEITRNSPITGYSLSYRLVE